MYCRVRRGREIWTARVLDAGDAAADREAHEARQVVDAELEHDAAAVGVDARRRDPQARGDLLAGEARDHQLEHLALAAAQLLERVVLRVAHPLDAREHVPRLPGAVGTQRRALARPQDLAALGAIAPVARELALAEGELRDQRRVVLALGNLGDVPA